MFGRMGASVAHGGNNIVHAALASLSTGTYIQDGEIEQPSAEARYPRVQSELIRYTGPAIRFPALETRAHHQAGHTRRPAERAVGKEGGGTSRNRVGR